MNLPLIVLLFINYCVINYFYLFPFLLYKKYNEISGHILQKFDQGCCQIDLHCFKYGKCLQYILVRENIISPLNISLKSITSKGVHDALALVLL